MIAMTFLHAIPATTSHSTSPTLLSRPIITSRSFLLYPSVPYRFSASTTFRYASKSNLLSLGSLITIRSLLALLCKQFNIEETIFSKHIQVKICCSPEARLGKITNAGTNVLPPLSVFALAGDFDFEYSAFAFSINCCLCSYSLLIAASFAADESFAWWYIP